MGAKSDNNAMGAKRDERCIKISSTRMRREKSTKMTREEGSKTRKNSRRLGKKIMALAFVGWALVFVQHMNLLRQEDNFISLTKVARSLIDIARSTDLPTATNNPGSKLVVFYNIETAEDESLSKAKNVTLEMVRQQLDILRDSLALTAHEQATVFYKTFGKRISMNQTELCHGDVRCVNIGHQNKIVDLRILERLHDHCSQHQQDTVVYLKTNPSFYARRKDATEEAIWRKHLTAAATSRECLELREDECNVCGLQFSPLPALAFPGNIWSARCSYVKELVSPVEFNDAITRVITEEKRLIASHKLLFTLYGRDYSWSGGSRPAVWEQWVASHPSLNPCDLSPTANVKHWVVDVEGKNDTFQWGMAPRRDVLARWFQLDKKNAVAMMAQNRTRQRDYFFLAGNLMKWKVLYHQTPPETSWAFSWFPDSDFWRSAVKMHGIDAVEKTLREDLAFPQDPDTSTPFAVFYNIYIHRNNKTKIERALSIVSEQIQQVARSDANHYQNKKLTLYYSTVGGTFPTADWMESLCTAHGLVCQFLRHFDKGDEDVTLDRVHEYCKERDDSKSVIYIHSKGSFHGEDSPKFYGQDRWRRHMTDAVTSKGCLEPQNSTCNVCGLLFQPLPAEHFTGNMWVSKCGYIRKLIPPGRMKNRRATTVQAAKKIIAQGAILDAKLCPFKYLLLGMGRYFSEHWVGTHPSIRPCDLSSTPSLTYWKSQDRNSSEFEFAMAPRHGIDAAGWDFYSYCDDTSVLANQTERLREYFLLPGHLYRWRKEYNATPPDDSFVWSWYPDGEDLKEKIIREGKAAFSSMKSSDSEGSILHSPSSVYTEMR